MKMLDLEEEATGALPLRWGVEGEVSRRWQMSCLLNFFVTCNPVGLNSLLLMQLPLLLLLLLMIAAAAATTLMLLSG